MKETIFRKKNLDRMSSPDALNNTIKVTQPAVWIALVALVMVLLGFIVWAAFGTLDGTVETVVVSDETKTGCYVSEHDVMQIEKGMKVVDSSGEYIIGDIIVDECRFANTADDYVIHVGNFDRDEYLYYFDIPEYVEEGTRKGKIITESINAISFLWNDNQGN